jgi:peptidoglycan/xylan/chitin deacetylase (PgdA/CDA1 family)
MQATTVKRALVSAVTRPWVAPIFTPLLRGAGAVLMLHRFADPELGGTGHDPALLRANLAGLRRDGREVVSLAELVRRVQEDDLGTSSPIAFTVDDGYADFPAIGAPVFAEFDCPVTVFLATGALDGPCWFWWDRVTAAFQRTPLREAVLTIGGVRHDLSWSDEHERLAVETQVMDALKLVSDAERHRLLAQLPEQLEVELPDRPPPEFAPMTWNAARACASRGVTVGAHTVTHPILSRVSPAAARCEIETSWRRLEEERLPTTDVFCYPNGEPADFTDREPALLRELGFRAAVTSTPGYITSTSYRSLGDDAAYRLPRFSLPRRAADFVQISSGFARAKLALRRVGLA